MCQLLVSAPHAHRLVLEVLEVCHRLDKQENKAEIQ